MEGNYDVRYIRREQTLGLLNTVLQQLGAVEAKQSLRESWLGLEQLGKPVVIILDQVEEVYNRPNPSLPDELEQFLDALKDVFLSSGIDQRPKGKLILGLRKERFIDIWQRLIDLTLPRTNVILEPLDRDDVIEAVRGPISSERLKQQYQLFIDPKLPEMIADDMRVDSGSAIAPMLQILLSRM